jgi:hypothetical protein
LSLVIASRAPLRRATAGTAVVVDPAEGPYDARAERANLTAVCAARSGSRPLAALAPFGWRYAAASTATFPGKIGAYEEDGSGVESRHIISA